MFGYTIDFDAPWYLLLLALLPLVGWFSYRSLAGLGHSRRLLAIGLRSVVLACLVLALAGIQLVRSSDRLTVIYLLDQSLSIPSDRRQAMLDYVNREIAEHRQRDDRAGVIVFGRDAAIEVPPFDESLKVNQVESPLDPAHTNLAGAMRLAQASFPEDAAKRIVIVSDGNENLGDAIEQARGVVESGVSIDVCPVRFSAGSDVRVEKVAAPADIRRGTPFDLRIVVNNTASATPDDPGIVSGTLIVRQRRDDQPVTISEENVQLRPGRHVFSVRRQIDAPDFYTYEAEFLPDDAAADVLRENNEASAFAHVRGSGQVLLIEDHQNPGEHTFLAERLRNANLEVTERPSDQLFASLAELQQFDSIILANVPREHFSDDQIGILVRNTQQMGCGLIMLGGPNSFGAGGWVNTEVEKAMPVDFEIKSAKVVPRGALVMIMHASEIANGNYWQKVIGQEAIKALGSQDLAGVLHYSNAGADSWLWGGMAVVGGNREKMLARLDQMVPGDMPDFGPTMEMARKALVKLEDAAVKHMIIISDGDPAPPAPAILRGLVAAKVTVTTVAVGAHGPAESRLLERIASQTGGKFYAVNSPNTLPRIFQREARRVARPLIFEHPPGFEPQINFPSEVLSGIQPPIPPITGFVMTTVKQNPLVEVLLLSPRPTGEARNNTLLATWTYGLGRSVAFTSDAGARWTANWHNWDGYEKLFSQMVRWSMRPVGDSGNFAVSTDVVEGQGRVVVTALDQNDQFLNFLDLKGAAIGPDLKSRDIKLAQVAPGRYVGTFDATEAGSYFVMLSPGAGRAPIRTGLNVPYSAEFRATQTNQALLDNLARMADSSGLSGKVIADASGKDRLEELLKTNTFRHDLPKARSSQDAWPVLLLVAGCLFFFDVFVRRVAISLAWVGPLAVRINERIRGRMAVAPVEEYLERLSTRKAEVGAEIESRRAAARFEPQPLPAGADQAAVEPLPGAPPSAAKTEAGPAQGLAPDQQEEESYTSRLLRAKKKVWEDRDQQKEQE